MNRSLMPIGPVTHQAETKRRWIRKGTFSCWACKRRKIRCDLDTDQGPCGECRRRNRRCVSQLYPESSTEARNDERLHVKVTRLESVIHGLIGKIIDCNDYNIRPDASVQASGGHQGQGNSPVLPGMTAAGLDLPTLPLISPADDTSLLEGHHEYDDISRRLLKAWPRAYDLDIILDLPGEISGLFHGLVLGPAAKVLPPQNTSAKQIIQIPRGKPHPIMIMRRLLLLASWIQRLSPACLRRLEHANINYQQVMISAIEAAHRCGTRDYELLDSVEGIECIMIESMFFHNAGQLRRAWRSMSRAIPIAQLMGLHQDLEFQRPVFIDQQSRQRIYPEYIWLRLVQMNRYLALILGLPQATTNNSFAEGNILQSCSAIERMQRTECAAAGYILQRNESGLLDPSTTQTIDCMLQESAACLPATWWQMPDLRASMNQQSATLEEVVRAMDQLTHHYLVSQLHLPYLTRHCSASEYDYNRIMAIDASREVLLRFTALQGVRNYASFCRGINFLAFISCTVLCIVHITIKRQFRDSNHDDHPLMSSVASRHTEDRELMELALRGMQRTAREDKDPIASSTGEFLSHLLIMEASASVCEMSISESLPGVERGFGCGGKVSDCSRTLEIHIPYFGTTKFERKDSTDYVLRRLLYI